MPPFVKVEAAVIAAERIDRTGRQFGVLCGVVALLTVGLLAYALTFSFTWDEGFHLLAAQLILSGKRPYLDFFHAQTPLYAYWNAAWMWLLGEKWRVSHALSSVLTGGATFLAADFVFRRFESSSWRLAAGVTAAVLTAANVTVVAFGTLGQPYGMCLFLTVAAFRLAILAAGEDRWRYAAGAGILAGAGAACSLLTAPLAPILLLWILWQSEKGRRMRKFAAFVAAAAIPSLPFLWFVAQSPRKVFFDVFEWHLFYRHVNWDNERQWDFDIITSWLDSSHGFLLAILAIAGLYHVATCKEWDRNRRAEFYLSAWIAAGIGVYLACTHPTFTRYFVLIVPFVSILAAVGLYAVAIRFDGARYPLAFTLVLTILIGIGLWRHLSDEWESYVWADFEAVAKKVDEVTPRNGVLWADEPIYFLTRRTPPSGMEFAYSHKISLAPDLARSLHILSNADISQQVLERKFDTVVNCEDEDDVKRFGLAKVYRQRVEVAECQVFWDRIPR
jgi:hypothetical protein